MNQSNKPLSTEELYNSIVNKTVVTSNKSKLDEIRISLRESQTTTLMTEEEEKIRTLLEQNKLEKDRFELLKHKIKLWKQYSSLLSSAFYYDDFKYSRSCLYSSITISAVVNLYLLKINPHFPLKNFTCVSSWLLSAVFFAFALNHDIHTVETQTDSQIGTKLRQVKNGVALLNPYVRPILDDDLEGKRVSWE